MFEVAGYNIQRELTEGSLVISLVQTSHIQVHFRYILVNTKPNHLRLQKNVKLGVVAEVGGGKG